MQSQDVILGGVFVALLYQQPLLLAVGRPALHRAVRTTERVCTAQLEPMHLDIELARAYGFRRVTRRINRAILTAVPHDHRARAVIAFGDQPFEIGVFDRMVLDHHGEPLVMWIERGSLRYRPRAQHPFHLESEIVMERARRVFLHDEHPTGARTRCDRCATERFGLATRTPLLAILLERHYSPLIRPTPR